MSTLKENLLDQRKNSCSGTSNKKYSKNSKVIENLIKSEGGNDVFGFGKREDILQISFM